MNGRRAGAWVAVALSAAVSPAIADEPSEIVPFHVEDPSRWGTARVIVQPAFPQEAKAGKLGGYVDVAGVITATGKLKDVVLTPDVAESSPFVEALRNVIGYWRYYVPIGNNCLPDERPTRVRVWFEFEGDRPKVFVSQKSSLPDKRPRPMKAMHREQPAYPREMLRSGLEASVYARSEVAPDGTVTDVKALAYFEGKKRGELLPFEREAERALALWTFSPAPEGQPRVRISCITVDFVLKG